jgi:hypothetical protein
MAVSQRFQAYRIGNDFAMPLARIIHECRREAAEIEAPFISPAHPRRAKTRPFSRGLLASEDDAGVLTVRRGDRTRKAPPVERIGRCSRCS